MSKIIKDKHIGEAALSKKPTQGISLVINEGAVTTDKIADKAVTPEKLSDSVKEELVDPSIQDLQNQIDSIQTTGIALSGELGDNTHIGIHQQKITETVNDLDSRIISAGDKADEALMLARSISETPAVNKVFVGSDNNEGMLEPEAGIITWPTPIRQIIYITHWREEEVSWQGEEGEYWYDPIENMLYLFVTEGNHTYTINVTFHPESLYIYNNEGYRYDVTSNTLVKVLNGASGSNTSGKIFPVVARTQNIDTDPIDYTKVNIGDYLFIEDYVAKYIGNGAIDTNIEDGTFFVWEEDLFMSTQGGYLSTMIDHYVVTNDIINRAVTTDKIADKAITTTKIADKAITKDQIADMTIEGSNIRHATITGHHIASGTIDGEHIINKSITGNNIADQTITGDKLVNGTITNNKIQAGSIGEQEIAEGGVKGYNIGEEEITAFHLSSGCVGADALGDGVIYSTHIVDGEITTNKIKNLGVTTNKIANGAVTDGKLASRFVKSISINGRTPILPTIDTGNVNLVIESGGSGGGSSEDYDPYEDYAVLSGVVFNAYSLDKGGKYRITGDCYLNNNYTIPEGITFAFDGGKIVSANNNSYTLTGDNTKIVDTTEQIFGVKWNSTLNSITTIEVAGTWNIEFARPEWWGAKADGIDYGSWPLRIYGETVNSEEDEIEIQKNSNGKIVMPPNSEDVYPEYPDVFFSRDAYNTLISLDSSIVPAYTAFQVCYDSSEECFLFCPDGEHYYATWKNADQWNDYTDPEHPKARLDCIFISEYEVGTGTNRRTFGSTSGIQTAAHIFKYMEDGETSARVLNPVFIDVASNIGEEHSYNYDCGLPFQKALMMGKGQIKLQQNGVYTFRTTRSANSSIDCIHLYNVGFDSVFEGNNATLFFLPHHDDFSGIYIDCLLQHGIQYKIQNLKLTTIKGFCTSDSNDYTHADFTSSFCTGFFINRGNYLVIDNVEFYNMNQDFNIKWSSSLVTPGRSVTINRWKSFECTQPMYYGIGTSKVIVDNSDIRIRKFGCPAHHIFYLTLKGQNNRQHFICRNTKIYVPDGFTNCPINISSWKDAIGDYTINTSSDPKDEECFISRVLHTVELENCDITAPEIATIANGVLVLMNKVRFFSTGAVTLNNTLTEISAGTVFTKSMNAPSNIQLVDCTFDCRGTRFLYFGIDQSGNEGYDHLLIDNCKVKTTYNQSHFEDATIHSELADAIIAMKGSIEVRNSSFDAPYSPIISLGGYADSNYTNEYMCKKFILENNIVDCAGFFFASCRVDFTPGSVVHGNRICISKDRIHKRSTYSPFIAALVTCYDGRRSGYSDRYSTLKNVAITYNKMVTKLRSIDSSYIILDTAITNGIENEEFTAYIGNTIDGNLASSSTEQIEQ